MENKNKKYKMLLKIGSIPFLLALIYSVVKLIINKNVYVVFDVQMHGLVALCNCFFFTIMSFFPIYLIDIFMMIIVGFKWQKSRAYYITLTLGILLILFILAGALFNLKAILYSIRELWYIFVLAVGLILYSIIKLKNGKCEDIKNE